MNYKNVNDRLFFMEIYLKLYYYNMYTMYYMYGLMYSPLKFALLHENIKVDFILKITIFYTQCIVCKSEFFELSKLSLKCTLNVAFLWNFKSLLWCLFFLIFKVYGHILQKQTIRIFFAFLKVNFIVSEKKRENIIVEDTRLLIKARCSFLVIKYEKCVIEMTTNKRRKSLLQFIFVVVFVIFFLFH